MLDRRPSIASPFAAFAVPATVLPAAGGSLSASVIWDAYKPDVEDSADVVAYDSEWAVFRRDEVVELEVGDTFTAARLTGQAIRTYRVDRVDRRDPDLYYAAVREAA